MDQPVTVKSKSEGKFTFHLPKSLHLDMVLLVTCISLIAVGLIMVNSTTWFSSYQGNKDIEYYFNHQVISFLIGLVPAVLVYLLDYRKLRQLALPAIGLAIVLLVAVQIFGEVTNDSKRNILVFGFSVQASEPAKLAVIFYLSYWLSSKKDVMNNFSLGLIPMATILGMIAGLIMIQPDLSAAITVIILGGIMFFIGGGKWRWIASALTVVAIITLMIAGLNTGFSNKIRSRMETYVEGIKDPTKGNDHLQQAVKSIANGKIFGVGLGHSTVKFGNLPVAHTDSIFAVIVEETGLVGAILVAGLFILFLWRGLRIAFRSTNPVGRLLAGGLTLWITLEAVVNMGVMVNIIPFAGNTLPMISYGGSSLVVVMTAIAFIQNVEKINLEDRQKAVSEGRSFSAVVNLRGGNGRRRVSRLDRSSGTR